jgi:hypothetical protein
MKIKNLLRAPSIESVALRELEAAKRDLLQMQDTQEYAAKMVEYHQGKIERLTAYLSAVMPA